jgi:hypothetical protein
MFVEFNRGALRGGTMVTVIEGKYIKRRWDKCAYLHFILTGDQLGVITSSFRDKMKAQTVTPKSSRFTPFSKTLKAPCRDAAVRTGEITAR